MDVKIENIIEKIKNDGVMEARKTSDQIIKKAEEEAGRILSKAKKEAEELRERAESEAAQFVSSSKEALRQASRDVVLKVREQLIRFCDSVFNQQISNILTPEGLNDIIGRIIEVWAVEKDQAIEIIVNERDRKAVTELVLSEVKNKAKKQITIKAGHSIDKGFRIGIKGESGYYDFSDASIVESLKELVNPVLASIIEEKK